MIRMPRLAFGLLLPAILALMAQSPSPARAAELQPLAPNGLAQTPPMGWNSWNRFGCDVSDALVRSMADALVASGMKDAGYNYVVIDDCWHGARDAHGDIQPDPQRFPAGIKALADYVHARGLRFGIYSDAGARTCAERPGSQGHEFQDARQYAAWGVDYLKYDWCNTGTRDAREAYRTMAEALRAWGRPIVLSICEWGTSKPWLWAAGVGNLWRTTGDIYDAWEGKKDWSIGVMNILDLQAGLEAFSGPGHWNDPDMLEVGNGGMTGDEYRAHFSLWAMLAAPLIAGNDLAKMSEETRAILTNREVIAIDQDPLGVQAKRVAKDGDGEVWVRPLADGGRAVALLNRSSTPRRIAVRWTDLGYPAGLSLKARDLWRARDLPRAKGGFEAEVAPHAVVMVRLGL
jgi:alpha-galactosidase